MTLPTTTRRWILANKPTNLPVLEGETPTFESVSADLPELKDGEVLAQTLYISNEPAQRAWIDANADPQRLYVPPVEQGEIMRSLSVMKVLESKAADIAKDSIFVTLASGWSEYAVVSARDVRPVRNIPGISPTHYLGALGPTGLTAYYGLVTTIGAKAGESLVVSGAAGATGSMVVQIAKHIVGCSKVIGIAGSDDKCRWVESLGADLCINYKHPDWKKQLIEATEGFVDMYYDNVGGEHLDLMLTRLATFGRVAACGAISGYNEAESGSLKNYTQIIIQRLNIKGFVVTDFLKTKEAPEAVKLLIDAAVNKKIKVGDENETVVETKFEDIPKTWMMLFKGANRGKLITKLV